MPALFERGLSGVSLVEPWAFCGPQTLAGFRWAWLDSDAIWRGMSELCDFGTGGGRLGRLFQTSRRAARYVTSHVNSTARGQRSGGSHWGGEHSCCLGICGLLTGFQVLKSNATRSQNGFMCLLRNCRRLVFGDRIRLGTQAGAPLGLTFAPCTGLVRTSMIAGLARWDKDCLVSGRTKRLPETAAG